MRTYLSIISIWHRRKKMHYTNFDVDEIGAFNNSQILL